MRLILMKGHERPVKFLKYNREGDLLFSCAKDRNPTVWFADNGERLGVYKGHNGAVWSCDVSRSGDSMRLITGSADQTVKLWNVQQIVVEMVQAVRIQSWFRCKNLGQPDPDQQPSLISPTSSYDIES